MDTIDEKVIELSRKKIILLILGSFVFVVLGVWILMLDEKSIQSQRIFISTTFMYGIGIVSIVFFGVTGFIGVKKIFDKKYGLIFNNTGVIDNSSGVSAGLIPWSEIIGVEIFELQKQKMLIIKVNDPQKYIQRGGKIKQAINKANYKMCGSPIAISSNALKIKFPELLMYFNQYRKKYGNNA